MVSCNQLNRVSFCTKNVFTIPHNGKNRESVFVWVLEQFGNCKPLLKKTSIEFIKSLFIRDRKVNNKGFFFDSIDYSRIILYFYKAIKTSINFEFYY